jgi:hypothetical protein
MIQLVEIYHNMRPLLPEQLWVDFENSCGVHSRKA